MSLELSGTTGVKGVAGSVSAPSIVGDDTNTGISFPSADTIKFSTGGVERMSITNSGVTGTGVGGKVLQYVVGTTTTQTYTSGTTYLDTGLTATITPSSGTKILVMVSQPTFTEMHNTSGQAEIYIQVLRDSTVLGRGSHGETLTSNGGWSNSQGTFSMFHLDTHGADGSTAVTYKTQYRHRGTAGQSYVQRTTEVSENRATIVLLELEA